MYFVIHIVSPKSVFYHPYSFLQNAFHQVLFVHLSISNIKHFSRFAWSLGWSSIFYGYDVPSLFFHGCCGMGGCKFAVCLGDHPFWMNVIHFWWILTMVWDGCYKLAYCLNPYCSTHLPTYDHVLSILDDLLNWMNTIDFGGYWSHYGMGCCQAWTMDHLESFSCQTIDSRKQLKKFWMIIEFSPHFGFCILHFIALYLHKEYEVLLSMRATTIA